MMQPATNIRANANDRLLTVIGSSWLGGSLIISVVLVLVLLIIGGAG